MARKVRSFPPHLAGSCLRYAAMDLLGFGRRIDADARARMAAGSAWHKTFMQELAAGGTLLAAEAPMRDPGMGVSGRADALIRAPSGEVTVVEYKTVHPDRFADITAARNPPIGFVAQLALYLEITHYPSGRLVIDSREAIRRRLQFSLQWPNDLGVWVRERVARTRSFAEDGKLPPREVGAHCLHCDRWERCYKSVEDRQAAVAEEPVWAPWPPLPPVEALRVVGEDVS